MEAYLLEKMNLKSVVVPVDLATAAITGGRIGLRSGDRVTLLLLIGASSSGGVIDITLQQHNAASAGTSKALTIKNPYYVKAGAATRFTKVDAAAVPVSNLVLSTTFDTASGIVAIEVLGEDLDTNGGFGFVSVNLLDAGASAKPGAVLAIAGGLSNLPGYSQDI